MIKKLIIYFSTFFFILLFLMTSIYTYNIIFLKQPIILGGFQEKVSNLIKDYVSKKMIDVDYDFDLGKSEIEINKFPHLVNLKLYDIKITNKNKSQSSYIDKANLGFSLEDILNNYLNKTEFSISKFHVNDITLRGKIHEKGFVPGPIL